MKTRALLLLVLLLIQPSVFAQDERAADFERRLRALEQRLGMPSSAGGAQNMDAMMKRLEALEQAVYGSAAEGAAPTSDDAEIPPPPPEAGGDLEWHEWTSDKDAVSPVGDGFSLPKPTDYLSAYGGGLQFSGYAWVSYVFDDKRDINTFRSNSIELDITKDLTDWAVFGTDLDFFNEGLDPVLAPFRHSRYSYGAGGGYGGAALGGDDDDDFVLEQLFVRMRATDSVEVTLGKFNVPTGLEPRDGNSRYSIIPSLLFPLWPRDLTGVMVTYKPTSDLTISPYVFNGWDLDENNNNSFIGALYTSYQITEPLRVASTVAYGPPFANNNTDDALLFDAELRYTPIPGLWTGIEFMYGNVQTEHFTGYKTLGEIDYYGVLGLAHYDFNKFFGLTAQGSWVDDVDGFLWGKPADRYELSLIPTFYLTDGFEIRLQYQHVESSEPLQFDLKPVYKSRTSNSDDIFGAAAYWWF